MLLRSFVRHHLCSELVSVDRVSRKRTGTPIEGNLEEIGEWSALVLTQKSIPTGTKIRVRGKSHELKGSVRSCTFDGLLGFFLDIELDDESRWSEKWFTPEHLLSLCPSLRCFTEKTAQVPEKFVPANPAHIGISRVVIHGCA